MRAGVLALVLAMMLALPAMAQDERPIKALRGQIESALRAHDFERAASIVDGVIADRERPTAVCAALADAVLELFPRELGNHRAARLAGRVLLDAKQRTALWSTVKDVRLRLIDDADVENGVWLFEQMRGIYSATSEANVQAVVRLDYDVAYLYLDGGRQNQAREALERIVTAHPRENEARLKLAEVLEGRGEIDGAIGQYDAVIQGGGEPRFVLEAHRLKGRVLLNTDREFAAAGQAVAAGLAAARDLPPGTSRERWLRIFGDEAANVDQTVAHWADVQALEGRVGRVLLGAAAAWVLVLGGVLVLMRRLRTGSTEQP
jgi:tetratricopeptide (TPR) repeat protein